MKPARSLLTAATVLSIGLGGSACRAQTNDGGAPRDPAPAARPPDDAVASAPSGAAPVSCQVASGGWRYPAVARVIAVGDVHGDLEATRRALRRGQVVDDHDRWIGGTTWVVQVGDQLDRGDDEQAILDWFERLEAEAAAAGGRFVWLLGNHELMNAAGQMSYVTPGGFRDFEDVAGLPLDKFADVPAPARARVAAFAPGGPYAKVLAGQHVVAAVGDTVFVHGGIRPGVAATLDEVDRAARCWLLGQGPMPAAVADPDGPLWDRSWASDDVDCAVLDRVLAELGAKRLVIAHTPQRAGITSACGDRLWRIDVGLSRHYSGPTQVLELTAAGATALR